MKSLIRNFLNFIRFFKRNDISIGKNARIGGSVFIKNNAIGENTIFTNGVIDRGSYIGANCHFNKTNIGKYCSIGNNVCLVTGTHPSRVFVSTHPAFFSTAKQAGFTYVKKQLFNEKLYSSEQPEIHLEIGNDVWIGNNVSIMGGIKIGDGAIIGTKSLVTKNVEPYSIVGGVPAKIISKRFTDEEIGFLLNAKWWEKDENWIIDNVDLFSNINNFIKHFHP